MAAFGDRVVKEPAGWALIPYNGCPYKNRKRGRRQRGGEVKTQEKDTIYKPWKSLEQTLPLWSFEGTSTADTLPHTSRLLTSFWVFCLFLGHTVNGILLWQP